MENFYNKLLLTAVCLATFIPFARSQQGVLTSDELMPTGTVFTMRMATDFGVDTTIQGQNVTWDLTNLQATGENLTNAIIDPATAPHIAQFPTANHVIYEEVVDRHSYFVVTENSMDRIGVYRNVLITYSDPQTEYVYPLTFGTTHSDTWANDNVSFPGTLGTECIGTGSLELPGHSYNDVLLIRVRLENIFTFFQYIWMDATNGMTLINYITPSPFTTEQLMFTTEFSIGMDEEANGIQMRVNTLVQDQLQLTYSSTAPLAYTITDLAGRVISEGRLAAQPIASRELLDVSSLSSGIHLLTLRDLDTGNFRTSRFMKN